MSAAHRTLILGQVLGVAALIACSTPPPTDEGVEAPPAPTEVTVVYQPTQLCPAPTACLQGDELIWVPEGTSLGVAELHVEELPRSTVHWFRVEYEGRAGWISEFATDKAPSVRGGKIVRD